MSETPHSENTAEPSFDINKMAAHFLESRADSIFESIKNSVKNLTGKIKINFRATFHKYLKTASERQSKSRSFFYSNEPQPLEKFYVPVGIRTDTFQIAALSAAALFKHSSYSVITGLGGCGKSVLLKRLFVDTMLLAEQIPVIVELRNLNNSHDGLEELILKTLENDGFELERRLFQEALKKGLFVILCDGFDELEASLQPKVASAINSLTKADPNLKIVVTSRPDTRFSGWNNFTVYSVLPLSLPKAVRLVDLAPVDVDLKARFIQDLKNTLYTRHSSFLSNPLLLSIMLLAYQDSADIPDRLSIFYNLAYISLFQKHDALKGGFKRERKSGLDLDSFAKVFGAFSTLTYGRRSFSFDRSTATSILRNTKKLTGMEIDPESFLHDASQAVCLLVEDGMTLSFSHRSFQEFFTAKFISQAPPEMKSQLAQRFSSDLQRDNVISLLHEMQPEFVESEIVLPALSDLFKKLKISRIPISRAQHLRYLQFFFDGIMVYTEGQKLRVHTTLITDIAEFNMLQFAIKRCSKNLPVLTDRLHDKPGAQEILQNMKESRKVYLFKNAKISDPLIKLCFDAHDFFGACILESSLNVLHRLKLDQKKYNASITRLLRID